MKKPKAKVLTIPKMPNPKARQPRSADPRYVEGQKLLVEAIAYLVKSDAETNIEAINLLSEHFRTQFRMSDRPSAD